MLMRITLLLSCLMLSLPSMAIEYKNSIGLGFNLDTVKSDLPDTFRFKNEYSPAATIGWRAIALWGNVGIRTGAFFEFKNVQIKNESAPLNNNSIDLRGYYAAIPVNLLFQINNRWAFFGGITPRILLAKTCDHCGTFNEDEQIVVNNYNGGIAYMFNNKLGLDVVFHNGADEYFKNIKINTTQLLLHYEL